MIFFHMFFFLFFFKFPKAIFEFFHKTLSHASAVLIIHLLIVKVKCSKNSFLPDDTITTSSDKLKSCHGQGKQINFQFS